MKSNITTSKIKRVKNITGLKTMQGNHLFGNGGTRLEGLISCQKKKKNLRKLKDSVFQ